MEKNNNVKLVFDKTIKCLAGYDFGLDIYNSQINNNLDLSKEYFLEFPDNIEDVSSSFVQGMFENIIKIIGISTVEERTHIVSKHSDLQTSIFSKLL